MHTESDKYIGDNLIDMSYIQVNNPSENKMKKREGVTTISVTPKPVLDQA